MGRPVLALPCAPGRGPHAAQRDYGYAGDRPCGLALGIAPSAAFDGAAPSAATTQSPRSGRGQLGAPPAHTVTPAHSHVALLSQGLSAGYAHSAPAPDSMPAAAARPVCTMVSAPR